MLINLHPKHTVDSKSTGPEEPPLPDLLLLQTSRNVPCTALKDEKTFSDMNDQKCQPVSD